MSPREAAEATGVHKLTILKWIRSGKLPADRIKTSNGDGYDIRPEDLTAALQLPRRKKDPAPVPVQGSVQASIDALRLVIEDQARTIERLEAEQRDTRHQLHQMHEQVIHALMPRQPEPAPESKLTDEQAAKLTEIEDRLTRVVDKLERDQVPFWQRLTGRKKNQP